MQFKVPQFIDIEDKVFGSLSFRQFAYLAGGAGLSYLCIKILPVILSIFIVPAVAAFALALAFFKVNEKPFARAVEAFIRYRLNSRLYLWKKVPKKQTAVPETGKSNELKTILTESKLKTLSWSLDVIDPKK